ncbi:glycosyltransferase family 2 protein [uncultured Nitrospira sp.]|uniref:glycosyltransferase family 2 protein n=1 Tax=uncultured Nitrospira sp. TaxID=157176 RepID=UPI003140A6CD
MMRPLLSIVVPIYNEEECVHPLYEAIRTACERNGQSYEIVFADDGSKDRTYELLEDIHRKNSEVTVIRLRKNFGQTAAMAAGFRAARGHVIISMDGDLQNDPSDIPQLLAKIAEGYDVVCGWRKERKDKFLSRRFPSLIANWLIGKITGVAIHDNGCSLKAYRASIIKRVALYSELHRFIPAMATLSGARITELVVTHHPRIFGKSKYGISRAWRVFLDLFLVKMVTGFAARPALWFAILAIPGALLAVLSFVGMVFSETIGIVFPATTFLLCALTGHLLTMGMLGEMILYSGDFRPDQMIWRVQTK